MNITATELKKQKILPLALTKSGLITKRLLDIVGSISCLIALSPILAAIAVAIKIDSPGPVLFSQRRIGYGLKPFVFYKFRSMVVDANQDVHQEHIRGLIYGHDGGNLDAERMRHDLKQDDRVTRLGRLLRKTSIDELPQLLNVLKGEMSLVGPRPSIPYEVKMYKNWYLERFDCAPGITGLAQVSGRKELSFEDIMHLDIDYVKHRSLWLDIRIIAKTVLVVFKEQGAW